MQVAIATPVAFATIRSAVKVDPVFGLIQAHRNANAALSEAVTKADTLDKGPEQRVAEIALDRAYRAEGAALLAAMSAAPTTIAGCVALLAYMGESEFGERPGPLATTRLAGALQSRAARKAAAAWQFLPRMAARIEALARK